MPPTAELDTVQVAAVQAWHGVLEFLVGVQDKPPPPPRVLALLISTGLVQSKHYRRRAGASGAAAAAPGPEDDMADLADDALSMVNRMSNARMTALRAAVAPGRVRATPKGLRFLLADTPSQLWTFLAEYVNALGEEPMQAAHVLAMLFRLGFVPVGQPVPVAALSAVHELLLPDLQSLGLVHVWTEPDDQVWFCATPLAHALVRAPSSAAAAGTQVGSAKPDQPVADPWGDLRIVVEKNYKLYAYCSSALGAALLGLFARVDVILPNAVVARLSRASVGKAYIQGLTPEDITGFLQRRIHAETSRDGDGLPENVRESLRLWAAQQQRFTAADCLLVQNFPNDARFRFVKRAMQQAGYALVWDDTKYQLAVADMPAAAAALRQANEQSKLA